MPSFQESDELHNVPFDISFESRLFSVLFEGHFLGTTVDGVSRQIKSLNLSAVFFSSSQFSGGLFVYCVCRVRYKASILKNTHILQLQ